MTVSVQLGNASSFAQYSDNAFTFNPTFSNLGEYSIQVVLTDNAMFPESSIYSFMVIVSTSNMNSAAKIRFEREKKEAEKF